MLTKRDFSQLPEEIIHHILSFCEARESVRSSVLCRAWYDAYSTRPVLVFDPLQFGGGEEDFLDFCRYVGGTLQSYQDRKISVQEVRFESLDMGDPLGYCKFIDEWIRKAVGCSVQKLRLTSPWSFEKPFEIGGRSAIYSAESLEELHLDGCFLFEPPKSAVVGRNLKKLRLNNEVVCDGVVEDLLSICPMIEDLKIIDISEMGLSHLLKLRHLKKVKLSSGRILQDVKPPYSFQRLTDLRLTIVKVQAEFFNNFAEKFPRLVRLKLRSCTASLCGEEHCTALLGGEEHYILPPSRRSLRRLAISNVGVAKIMELELPGLLHYTDSSGGYDMHLDLHGGVVLNEVISSKITVRYDHFWFSSSFSSFLLMLRGYLKKVAFSRITVEIRFLYLTFVRHGGDDDAPPLPPPQKIDELNLIIEYSSPSASLRVVLGAFLRICHPDTITVECCLCNELIGALESFSGNPNEGSYQVREIILMEVKNKPVRSAHMKGLDELLPLENYYIKICFKLDWEEQC